MIPFHRAIELSVDEIGPTMVPLPPVDKSTLAKVVAPVLRIACEAPEVANAVKLVSSSTSALVRSTDESPMYPMWFLQF